MLLRDIQLGFRKLLQQPGFTLVAILALGVGIGANCAIFSLLDAVVLSPLPYRQPERIVAIWASSPDQGLEQTEVSFPKIRALAEGGKSWRSVATYMEEELNLTERDNPETVDGARVSASFFDVWGIEPILGRRFLPAEDRKGGANVVLLSQGYWERRFGGEKGILGLVLHLDGKAYTVVGVLPQVLRFPFSQVQLWVPRPNEMSFLSDEQVEHGSGYLFAAGRLAPGVSLKKAAEEAERINQRYAEQWKGNQDATFHLKLLPMGQQLVGESRTALLLLLGAVGFVLLIACADVANLLLAQGMARGREVAIRVALGASRSQILVQRMVEGILLAILGSALGLLLAHWGLRLLVAANPANLPRLEEAGLHGRVLGFTLVLALLTGVLASLAPALQTTRTDPRTALREGDRGATGGARRGRTQGLLVAVEVALALVLLIGASLLIRSFRTVSSVDPGFDTRNLLVSQVSLPTVKYPTIETRRVFFESMLERIRAIPGVQSATFSDFLPIQGTAHANILVEGQPVPPPDQQPLVWRLMVNPGYFQTLGVQLLAGRDFDPKAGPDSPVEVLINDSLRRRFFADRDPVGQHLLLGRLHLRAEIVGVVADVQQLGLDTRKEAEFFVSAREARKELAPTTFMQLQVRTSLPVENVAQAVRREVQGLDREQPVADLQTMDSIVAASIASRRLTMGLLSGFSAVALALCFLGIYGVVAHSVSLREKEIGVRMALGAQAGQVLGAVTRQSFRWIFLGLVVGLAAALLLSRVLESLLFEVSPTDPLYLTTTPIVLALVALLACYLPARRATRIAPAITLRNE
jgi:putative ABC transport system permease protein